MKTTLLKMKNILGLKELQLNGASVEITGTNGTGKSSVLDAIRVLLTNIAPRDVIVRQGETEAELLLETDTGLHIERKKRTNMSDYKQIRENGHDVPSPEAALREIFTPLQLDPVAFTQMTKAEQNKIILGLIEYQWDLNTIREWFGEVPAGIDYSQHILQVLNDIQDDKSPYFKDRQEVNRKIFAQKTIAEGIAKDIPAGYQAEKWAEYNTGAAYKKLTDAQQHNSAIQRAKGFRESFQNKLRGLEANRDIAVNAERQQITTQRENLVSSIERMKAEIKAAEDKLAGLESKLADRVAVIEAEHQAAVEKLKADTTVADEWADKTPIPTDALQEEINTAEAMIRHLNEYTRMQAALAEVAKLDAVSKEYTRKIELARSLPGEILKTATIPVEGLTVENGVPLIHGLPVTNLSEGEQLDLCVDVTISKPGTLQIILIDGAEKLSDANRARLYAKCKAKGLQFVSSRTTNDDELQVVEL
jgi:DNA repair exonuclease SbcCD ATPase subunit